MLKSTLTNLRVKYLDWAIGFFWDFPIISYSILLILIHSDYSLKGLAFFFVAFLIQFLVYPLFNFAHDGIELFDLLSFMKEYPECDFYEVDISEYIDESLLEKGGFEVVNKIRNKPLKRLMAKQGKHYNSLSKVIVIKSNNSEYAPAGLKSFPTLYHGNFVFLRGFPDELNSIDKYRTFHELFHSSFTSLMPIKRAVVRGMVPLKLLMIYMLTFSVFNLETAMVMVAIFSIIVTSEAHYWSSEIREALMLNEIFSDYFALKNLGAEEKNEIFNSKYCYSLPMHDPKLGDILNSHRLIQFKKIVEGFKYMGDYNFEDIYFYPKIPIGVYSVLILSLLHSFNSIEYSWRTIIALSVIFIILLIWISLIHLGIQNFKNEIQERIKAGTNNG